VAYKNIEDRRANKRKYYQINKEKIDLLHKDYYQENKEYFREYHIVHREKILERQKEHYQNNKREYITRTARNNKRRRRIDLKFNLNEKISSLIRYSLRNNKNGLYWEILVGYNLQDLINHLKSTIPEGCTWQDFIEGKLQIDHITPKTAFNFTKPEHTDFKKCWSLDNLRLLPVKENLNKHNKISRPFQPALQI